MAALGSTVGAVPEAQSCPSAATAFIESTSGAHRFAIADEPLTIGGGPNSDVTVAGPEVQVRIWPRAGRYMLHVVAGAVTVNGSVTDWAVLDDGDMLEIGDATFRFRREDSE